MQRVKEIIAYNIPRIYNLPDVFYIRWRDKEFFIRKV